ncbi:MAG: AAA family ATPase, partial [Minwuiales bacterium]|nr:AAA family ATPase [Minwuiales bacterium]
MYEDRYGFREKPFSLTPNPKFFFSNGSFQRAYEGLLAGVRDRRGILLLTGEAGCGKTMLLRKLRENLDPSDRIVAFHFTNLAPADFLSFVCENLGVETKATDIDGQLKDVAEFLAGLRRAGRSAALLIDEAENLREEVLQMLPALAGGEPGGEAALQIVLVGRPQLEITLARAELTELRQRITAQYRLERLTEDEIAAFIKHRLSVVGYTRESPFTSYAVVLIARLSGGIPRLVNVICDRAFQIAADSDSRRVSTAMIQQVSQELGLGREDDPTTEAILAAERSLPPRIEKAEPAPETEPAATPAAPITPPLAERAAEAKLMPPDPVPTPAARPEPPQPRAEREPEEPPRPRETDEPRLDVDRSRRKAPELGATRRRSAAVEAAPPPRRMRWAAA